MKKILVQYHKKIYAKDKVQYVFISFIKTAKKIRDLVAYDKRLFYVIKKSSKFRICLYKETPLTCLRHNKCLEFFSVTWDKIVQLISFGPQYP